MVRELKSLEIYEFSLTYENGSNRINVDNRKNKITDLRIEINIKLNRIKKQNLFFGKD